MQYIRYILCVIAVQFGIAGCISTTPYPDEWSPLGINTTSQCPNLSGSYENFGLSATDPADRYKPMLAEVFFPQDGPGYTALKAVSHVTIDDQGDDGLVVKAWVGDELLVERLLIASQLTCIEGNRIFHNTSWDYAGLKMLPIFLASRKSTDHLISLTADGSLVMQNNDIEIGVVTIIPMAGKGQNWYKFSRTSPDTPGLHTDSNSPQGVRHGMAPAYSLLPPEGKKRQSSINNDTKDCLKQESGIDVAPDPQAMALLGGRSTQAFLIQYGRDVELWPFTRVEGWTLVVPATHTLGIEKMHWQPPSVADRYVICLLRKGYRWENRGELAVGQEFAMP